MLRKSLKLTVAALVLLTLIGCSSTKPLEILIAPIKQVNLNLPEVDAITLDKVEWYIINKDNAEAVFAELDKKGYDEVLFGLNDKGYEIISVNMAKILSLVRQQAAIIGAYKKYHDTQTEVIKTIKMKQQSNEKKTKRLKRMAKELSSNDLGSGNLKADEKYRRYFFAVISMLAYREPNKTKKHWVNLGYKSDYYDVEGAQCYVLEHKDHIIVAFRGTEPKQFSDIKADLSIMKTWHKGEGKVHRGFMIEVWKLADLISPRVFDTKKQVYITGHSLGGGMATLFSTLCRPLSPPKVYTYGSPRAGDRTYSSAYPHLHTRVQNNNDMVTTVPPSLFMFKHCGQNVYINHYGHVRKLTTWQKIKDQWRGHMASWKKREFFDGLRDHSIDKYCINLLKDWKDASNS